MDIGLALIFIVGFIPVWAVLLVEIGFIIMEIGFIIMERIIDKGGRS
jgi:hypothetical protein